MSIKNHLTTLRSKHQELDRSVASLEAAPAADSLHITQLKKEKLQLKEEITDLEAKITRH
ncbi:YdcH family protein [Phyllobacterium zundukense]|uniref:DUF465 domain-containing protein n=1 Tax=Phyllobacterium zundukense TaxID=1867719 RepID=A0A2N9VV35_9HYPH|nr:YdcH family protein [Phyllobacterium zundukense]ATU94963.1 DUF465 domain-containing protein [Phyllobacterium zundukense]PIO43353.1 DUF465 domain-containing protein [Phyllobacterium zundukense]